MDTAQLLSWVKGISIDRWGSLIQLYHTAILRGSCWCPVVADELRSCRAGAARCGAASMSTPCWDPGWPAGLSALSCCRRQGGLGAFVLSSVLIGGSAVEIWREFQCVRWGYPPVSLPSGILF